MNLTPDSSSIAKATKFKILDCIKPINLSMGSDKGNSVPSGIFIGTSHKEKTPVNPNRNKVMNILKAQFILGVIGGIIAYTISAIFLKLSEPFLPPEYLALNQNPSSQIPLITRILYGGIVEELLIRWGLMTFFVWLQWKIFQKGSGKPKPIFFWLAIIAAAAIFGIGHLPVLFSLVSQPTFLLITLIIALNMVIGVIAGWLYWQKGLETAIFAHITFHIVLLLVSGIVN